MKTDLYTKTLLTVIALALTAIACRPLAAVRVQAVENSPGTRIAEQVASIERYVRGIARGEYPCQNKTLCP